MTAALPHNTKQVLLHPYHRWCRQFCEPSGKLGEPSRKLGEPSRKLGGRTRVVLVEWLVS